MSAPNAPYIEVRPRCSNASVTYYYRGADTGGTASSFRLVLNGPGPYISTITGPTWGFNQTGLTNGAYYSSFVTASNSFGESAPSYFRTVQPNGVPDPPTSLISSISTSTSIITLSWNAPISQTVPIGWYVVTNASNINDRSNTTFFDRKINLSNLLPGNNQYYIQSVSDTGYSAKLYTPLIYNPNWNPLVLSGLKLWLDANDSSTLFSDTSGLIPASSGSTVARWNDKSGMSNYFFQNSSGDRPLFTTFSSNKSIYFGTNNMKMTSINNNESTGNSSRTIFFLQYAPNNGSIARIGTGAHSGNSPPSAFGIDNNVPISILWSPYVYSGLDVTRSIQLKNFSLIYAYYDSSTSIVGGGYDFGNVLQKSTTLNTTASTWYLGLRPDNGGSVDSYVCEFIHYNRMLSQTEVEKVYGYIAWKWGLVSYLPSGNPYKNSPPLP
jgi:hypothetical protein